MSKRKKIVIVGGVAGGASCAARARRLSEEAEIVLVERGQHISFANCGMPYYIGGAIADRDRLLVQTPAAMRKRFRLDVRTRTEAVRINRDDRTVTLRDLQTGDEVQESYDVLVLSPGAEPVRPKLPGADHPKVFTLRNLSDMDAIKAAVDDGKPSRAVVVGGGYIGLEMTEALRERGVGVTLVELADQVFIAADPEMVAPIHEQLKLHGVDLRLKTSITAVREAGDDVSVLLSSGESVDAGLVVMAIGVRPEVKLAREAGLEIGPTGGIVVDDRMRTADEAIFAIGDAVQVTQLVDRSAALIPLAGPANRQGRIVADTIFGRDSTYKASQGTAICKVFDLAIGMTGLSEKQLVRSGAAYEKIYVHPASHAGYYPGAAQMSLKLLFEPSSGRIYGAQAVGSDGVDKRIDVLATALRAGLTVHDLRDLELSYAPPYGSAKDPVNYAGFVASNVISGDCAICHTADVIDPGPDAILLDVRTAAEVEAGTIPGARHIPVDELRQRLGELPAGKTVLAFCQVGLRGYLACRILTQHGIACRNLTGGYKTYKAAAGAMKPEDSAPREITEDTGTAPAPGAVRMTCGGPAPADEGGARQDPTAMKNASAATATVSATREIDARGLQCPGPILRLKAEIDAMAPGEAVRVLASDPGFPSDAAGWCHATGHRLLEATPDNGHYRAVIVKEAPSPAPAGAAVVGPNGKGKSIVVFSGDFDKAMAAFIIANGAAAMGSDVTLFFTFWGLNILRRDRKVAVRKSLIEKMFGWMMPRGPRRLKLSKMNMGGMGTAMIKGVMKKKNVASLPELIESAKAAGVKLVACTMTMELMGIRAEELIDGVTQGGVAQYLDTASAGSVNLFI